MAIAVDLDGTLAYYDDWKGPEYIGTPIIPMLERVRKWIKEGEEVVIFTARATNEVQIYHIKKWLYFYGLEDLEITNIKLPKFKEIWDDRAIRVRANTGEPCCKSA